MDSARVGLQDRFAGPVCRAGLEANVRYLQKKKRDCERSEANGTLANLPQPAPDLFYLNRPSPHCDWARPEIIRNYTKAQSDCHATLAMTVVGPTIAC